MMKRINFLDLIKIGSSIKNIHFTPGTILNMVILWLNYLKIWKQGNMTQDKSF